MEMIGRQYGIHSVEPSAGAPFVTFLRCVAVPQGVGVGIAHHHLMSTQLLPGDKDARRRLDALETALFCRAPVFCACPWGRMTEAEPSNEFVSEYHEPSRLRLLVKSV